MKKVLRLLMFILCLISLTYINLSVKADNVVVDEFTNIEFISQPIISQSNKSKCIITWNTTKEIKYLKVIVQLQNSKGQVPYESGRENSAGTFESFKLSDDVFENILEIEVDNSQLGNIKIKFNYSYEPILPGTSTLSFTAIFVTGKWIDKQPTHHGLLAGVFITVVVGIATYVIIENNRREVTNYDYLDEAGEILDE